MLRNYFSRGLDEVYGYRTFDYDDSFIRACSSGWLQVVPTTVCTLMKREQHDDY